MLNISYIIPLVCFWHTITNEISKHTTQESISNNMIGLIHCLLFTAHHNYDYNVDYAVHMSIGYYIYDLIYIIKRIYKMKSKDEFERRFPFIVHHLIGVYLLNASQTGESKYHILYGYNILETSNIMLYVSYYLQKKYATYLHLNMISEFIQLLWYSYFRIIKLSSFIYINKTLFLQFQFITKSVIIILHFMGILWSYKLFKKNIKNFNMLKGMYGYGGSGSCSALLGKTNNSD
jgi:hypothetical protein